jgi:O-antigen/teichoic acid export membrane protein
MLVSLVVVAIVLLLGPLWSAPLGGFTLPLALGTTTGAATAVVIAAQALLRAEGQARRFVLLVLGVVGGQLLGVAGALLISPSASVYLTGLLVGASAAALAAVVWTRPTLAGWRADRERLRSWARIALPTIPHSCALFLLAAGDRLVIEAQRGDAGVAGYALAYQIGALGISVIAAANNAWAPMIYAASDEKRWALLASTTRTMLAVAAGLTVLIGVTAPISLWLLADPSKYSISALVPVVAVTALATIPYTLYLASAHVLFWSGRTTPLLWITPLAVAANLLAVALLLPYWGLVGAAFLTVAAYALLAALVYLERRRILASSLAHRDRSDRP